MAIDNLAPVTVKSLVIRKHRGSRPNDKPLIEKPYIALTCRLVRNELLPCYYSTKIDVFFRLDSLASFATAYWIRKIGTANRLHVRGVRAVTSYYYEGLEELLGREWTPFRGFQREFSLVEERTEERWERVLPTRSLNQAVDAY